MPRALGERSPGPQRGSLQKASWSTRHRGWGDVNWKAPAGKARQRVPPPRENGGEVGEKWHLKDTASRLKRSGSCEVRAREHPPLSASSRGARGPRIASCSPSHRLFICEPHDGIVPNDVSGEVVTWKPHLEKVRRELSPACGTGEGAAKSQEGVRTSSHRSTRNRQRGAWKRLAPRRGPGREASALAQSRRPAPAGRPLHPEQEKQDDVCTGTRNTNGRCWSREERRIVRDRTATRLRPR